MLVILTLNLLNFNKTALSPSLSSPTFQYFYTDISAISVTFRNSVATLSNTCHTSIASRENWTLLLPNTSVFLDCLPLLVERCIFQNKSWTIMGRLKFARAHIISHISISRPRVIAFQIWGQAIWDKIARGLVAFWHAKFCILWGNFLIWRNSLPIKSQKSPNLQSQSFWKIFLKKGCVGSVKVSRLSLQIWVCWSFHKQFSL